MPSWRDASASLRMDAIEIKAASKVKYYSLQSGPTKSFSIVKSLKFGHVNVEVSPSYIN
jgi:hypothetical protein